MMNTPHTSALFAGLKTKRLTFGTFSESEQLRVIYLWPGSMKDTTTKDHTPSKRAERRESSKVWINPNSSFKGPRGNRVWEQRQAPPPTAARLLELADVALGLAEPSPLQAKKKKAAA